MWRRIDDGRFAGDLVALLDEPGPEGAVPLLEPVMMDCVRLGTDSLEQARARLAAQRAALPPSLRHLDAGVYPVETAAGLEAISRAAAAEAGR